MRTKSLRLRGLETAWLEGDAPKKDAPILLFLHGFPDTPASWDRQMKHFSDRYQVIAPFARGAGSSEVAPTLDRYREGSTTLDLLQILKAVDPSGKRDIRLVGHDLGAVAAWNLAPLLGRRLKAMAIVNGLSLMQMFQRKRRLKQMMKSWYIYAFQIPRVPEFLARRFPESCLRLAHAIGRLPVADRPEIEVPIDGSLPHYRAFAREFPWLGRRETTKLQAPVLVLWGSEDAFLLPPKWEELTRYSAWPTSRVIQGNHWVHREKAEEVNQALERFFEGKAE